MHLNPDNLCYNCFREREGQDGPCPYCGFDRAENEKKYPVALRAGTVLNGRYIVGRVLGQGGFGITYLAWDTKLEAKVAVKEFMPGEIATRTGSTVSVLSADRGEDFTYGAERFQEEARTLAKFMGQPNIAGVTDYFDENDTSYFVMDYIEGISFKTYIANQGGKVSVDDALNVMIPVLRALTAVHAEGFIHRDVTPDNIYITKDGVVKLLDFGSARYSIGDKSKSLDVILKVGYAPKEQYIRRSRQGPYTDVYSCAACFYAALTGFLPPESLERLDQDTLVPVSQCGVDIPEYLDKAILKGLAVQPEDRFQSAAEFLEAIESQQVVEVPPSGGASAQSAQPERKRFKPALLGGIAAAVVLAAVGVGIAIGGGSSSGDVGGGNPIAEALAPTVTIGGEEYSTALTELDLSNKNLSNEEILPLMEMTELTSLTLYGNQLTELSALSGLSKLEFLNVGGNDGISDLSPLSGLTSLNQLVLPSNSEISDLSPLAGLTELRSLEMSDGIGENGAGMIDDLSPLAGLSKLENIFILVGDLTDLSFLSGKAKLESVRLYGDIQVENPAPLTGLTNLEQFQLYSTGGQATYIAQDLTALSELENLTTLDICTQGLTSLKGLECLTRLEMLSLDGAGGDNNIVTDLSPLTGLFQLKSLDLPIQSVDFQGSYDLSGLEALTALENLNITGNVNDLSPLAGLTNLISLKIYGNGTISDFSPLAEMTKLQDLNITNRSTPGNQTASLVPLAGLTDLRTLNLGQGDMSDLSPLSGLSKLRSLSLSSSTIRDLTPLGNLPELQSLYIYNSEKVDTSPVAHVPDLYVSQR